MRIQIACMAASLLMVGTHVSAQTPTSSPGTTPSTMGAGNTTQKGSAMDQQFVREAAEGGMTELEASKMALGKAGNAEVRKFAEMMIADHTKANQELTALAKQKGLEVPTAISKPEHKQAVEKLKNANGTEFDRAYVSAMLTDHEKDVALFQKQSQGMGDAEIKAFAAKTLPTLQKHLETVRGLQKKMTTM